MNPFMTISMTALERVRRSRHRHALRRATARAYVAFVEQYPHGEDVLFDEHFLSHRGLAVLQAYERGHSPNPVALAEACAEQWGDRGEKRAAFAQKLTPVAARFLRLLERELEHRGTAGGGLAS